MGNYYLAPSLVALRAELDAKWPRRDRSSDGWIGDAAHSSRASQHNPDWSSVPPGAVDALDVDVDGIDVRALMDAVVTDRRVWYVIHDRRIWSRTNGWKPKRYTGSNPHIKHVHVSIQPTRAAREDTGPWLSASSWPTAGVQAARNIIAGKPVKLVARPEVARVMTAQAAWLRSKRGLARAQAARNVINGRPIGRVRNPRVRAWQRKAADRAGKAGVGA